MFQLIANAIQYAKQAANIISQNISKNRQNSGPGQNIDVADQLAILADLKAQGILTEQEFAIQKTKIIQ